MSHKQCQIITAHEGDGSDIVGYFVLDAAQGNALWKHVDQGSDPWGFIVDKLTIEEPETSDSPRYHCKFFEHFMDAAKYITDNNLKVVHECGCGTY